MVQVGIRMGMRRGDGRGIGELSPSTLPFGNYEAPSVCLQRLGKKTSGRDSKSGSMKTGEGTNLEPGVKPAGDSREEISGA
jgi:hypothetical protein